MFVYIMHVYSGWIDFEISGIYPCAFYWKSASLFSKLDIETLEILVDLLQLSFVSFVLIFMLNTHLSIVYPGIDVISQVTEKLKQW